MKRKQAFTLIELLIVIAIIGILFIVLVSKVDFATDKAKATGVQTDFRSFQLAFDTVAREHQGFSSLVDEDYEQLEMSINKNLDNKLKIDIDADGTITMANGAQDPWNTEYHGYYITNATVDNKDRGAIVIYSNGANQEFGSEHSIANGVVTVNVPGNNKTGKDDYSIAVVYTYVNGYGEVKISTSGFSNNQTTQGNTSNNTGTEDTEDPDVTELLEPGLYNAGAIELAKAGDVEVAQDMIKTSWDDLLDAGIVHVTNGVVYSNLDFDTWENASSDALDGDLVLPNDGSITSIGDYTYDEDSGNYIGNIAFEYCYELTGIAIPNGVTSIGYEAFFYCENLTSVTIPNSVKIIDFAAFEECTSLTSIVIPDSVTSIGEDAFSYCKSLTSVIIPNGVTSISDCVFFGCDSLTNVTIPDGVTSIGSGAFQSCDNLTSITIPDGVTNIGSSAFNGCKGLTSIVIPDSVTSIGSLAFYGCSNLTSVVIPDSVIEIGDYTFSWCTSLTNVTIPNSVTNIGKNAFDTCTSLTSVTIPDSITSIGKRAFYYCWGLTTITFNGSVEQWSSISKESDWNDRVPATYVQCSDGQVTIQ